MNRCVWAVSAATIVFCGWQVISGIAQHNNNAAAAPVEAPALEPEPAAPAPTPEMAGTAPGSAEEIPAAGEQPVASPDAEDAETSASFPAETRPAPAAAGPEEDRPAGAIPDESGPAEAMPAEIKPEIFDIDRTPQVKSVFRTPAPAAPVEAVVGPPGRIGKKGETPEEMLANQEAARRQARDLEALKNLDLAYQAMSRTEFDEALKLFDQALSIMPERPYTVETRNKARLAQAQCEYRLALKHYRQGNLPEAAKSANRALGFVPNQKETLRLKERIARDIDKPEPPKGPAKPPPIRFSKEHLDREKRMKDAISRGRQYMAVHEYEKAALEFKTVLLEDKGNPEANANLKKIAEKGYRLETDQFERMKVEMMTQVRDTWTPAIKKDISHPVKLPEPEGGVISPEKQKMLTKLNTIVIPQLDFRAANIVDVIKYLDQQSIVADKDSPAGEKGVNIILKLMRPGAEGAIPTVPAAGAEDIFPAEGEAGAGAAAGSGNIPTVTLQLRNIVLLDAIKFITEVTGLKYRVEPNVVVITPAGVVEGEVISKTFRVQPNLGDLISGSLGAGAAAAAGGAAVGIGVDLTATPPTTPGGDVKKFFIEAGVPFPEGTSIKHQPSLNLLIVANTAENLEKLEQILQKINVVPVQVEIEARFVEVAQVDLEELGIEWLLTDNWEIAQDASAGAAVPLSARERLQINKNVFTKGLRNLSDPSGLTTPGGGMGGLFSLSSVLTNPELSFVLHALEQRGGANLLSAPKVTTKSGANAEIKVVREIIYPTEFEQTAQTAGGTAVAASAVVVTPTGFQTRDTGVILSVTPVVGPDGFTIDLTMMPQVVELADWINYGSTVIGPGGVPQQLNMPQPIFHSRSIATSISIWDGQTVVMGGLITEQAATTEDKIPFLGDIPLIGYLFRSKASKSDKRNLLIFVTANLVDPAGNRINPAGVNPTEPVSAVAVTTTP